MVLSVSNCGAVCGSAHISYGQYVEMLPLKSLGTSHKPHFFAFCGTSFGANRSFCNVEARCSGCRCGHFVCPCYFVLAIGNSHWVKTISGTCLAERFHSVPCGWHAVDMCTAKVILDRIEEVQIEVSEPRQELCHMCQSECE